MTEFEHITIADKPAIESYTLPSSITNCDMAFANMYCWEFIYQSRWAVMDGFLVIRFRIDGSKKMGYMQPIGEGDFTEIIPQLRENAHKHGQRLRIIGLTDRGCDEIRRAHPGEFAFASDRNVEDYIYKADDLRNLAGTRYKAKRNHINKFMSLYPNYRYEQMTRSHIDECMALVGEWQKSHSAEDERIVAEQGAMKRSFDSFDELGVFGGCLYVEDALVAFTFGTPVNSKTFVTHVEKANVEYNGVFAVINKLFSESLPPQYELINREEDMGVEGLRRAKMLYHPTVIQHKYTAIRLHRQECGCRRLWRECFGDEDRFIDAFLMYYYDQNNMLSLEVDDQIVSMLHLVPFQSELGRTTYIYGVATAVQHRGHGYATELMNRAMAIISDRGDDAAVLIPSGESLRDYYQQFGFGGASHVSFTSTDNFDFGSGDREEDIAMVWLANRDGASGEIPVQLTCDYKN